MIQKIAKVQHEIWAHWMTHLFDICNQNPDGSVTIPAEKVTRWKRQIRTEYEELTEEEKISDLEQAYKIILIIESEN